MPTGTACDLQKSRVAISRSRRCSIVYNKAREGGIQSGVESLPNFANVSGQIEAILCPAGVLIWSDNETAIDLLGFQYLTKAMCGIVKNGHRGTKANLLNKLDQQVLMFVLHSEQRQRIFSIERELASGLLPCTAQGNVHAPVLRQRHHLQVLQDFVLLLLTQVGVFGHQMFYLFGRHVIFFPRRFGHKISFRNAKSDKEAFCDFDAALRKILIVFRFSAAICIALQLEMRIRSACEIFLEVAR
jgi:hypothetical protein